MFRAQKTYAQATLQKGDSEAIVEIRTFQGNEYLVVPVVAMIEGVRFGAAQSTPELGLASEFGKIVDAWNNRPLVVNHPVVDNQFVSANILEVLEEYSFGFTANARIKNKKLLVDAWINLSRADQDENVQYFIDTINANEVIEVSVGFFLELEEASGTFNGQSYGGIWRNIVPDHLAFLTDAVGACSIEDGCGTSRVNQIQETNMSIKMNVSKFNNQSEGCGEYCSCENCSSEEAKINPTTTQSASKSGISSEEAGKKSVININAVDPTIVDMSIWTLLSKAVRDKFDDCYLNTYTVGDKSIAVFDIWTVNGYVTKGVFYNIAKDGAVSFEGDPFNVRVVSHLYKAEEQENTMSNNESTTQETKAAKDVPETQESKSEVPVVNNVQDLVTESKKEEVKNLSINQALEVMNSSDRKTVESALALQQERKDTAIKALQDSGRCAFDEEYLKAQSLDTLENFLKLADVNTYAGRVTPVDNVPTTQTANEKNGFVEPPKSIFAKQESAQ